jgi:glycerophosphoryl diester phosphodiesterase
MAVDSVTRVLAHRGASGHERENTLAAFRLAGALGADGVELDVRPTADGVLIVHHDSHLAAPDGREIATLAAGDLPDDVPTLAAAIEASRGLVNIEIKHEPADERRDLASAVVADPAVQAERDRILVSSFDLVSIDRVRGLDPGLATAWLVLAVVDDTLDTLVAHGHRVLHPWVGSLTAATVDACHARGVAVNTWTCDDPVRIAELVDWRVDGIVTNVPDVALAVRGGRRR